MQDKPTDGHNAILRVSFPWPDRTKEALRVSLDNGIFDDFTIALTRPTRRTIHFATVVLDSGVVSSLHSRTRSRPTFHLILWPLIETDILPSTLVMKLRALLT